MRIRTKLTLLLLALTLVPLSLLTGLDTYILHKLGRDVAEDVRSDLLGMTEEQLYASLAHYVDILRLERVLASARGFAAPDSSSGLWPHQRGAESGEPAQAQGGALPGAGASGQGGMRHPAAMSHPAMMNAPGMRAEAPARGAAAAPPGAPDAGAGPLPGAGGPISVQVVEEMLSRPALKDMVVLMVLPDAAMQSGYKVHMRIAADVPKLRWLPGSASEPLEVDSSDVLEQVRAAIQGGGEGAFHAPYGGRPCLWAYRQFDFLGAVFMITPLDRVSAMSREAEASILHATGLTLASTAGLGAAGLFMAALMALVASRRVTVPLEMLSSAARRVAVGDFDARAAIPGDDELSLLGRTFDDMVPRLQTQMHMQQALDLASEVQQRLLPGETPSVDGVDIAGLSTPCDETGGDYFDYLDTLGKAPGQATVVVGDVTGHGVSAALLMATARGMMRAAGGGGPELAERVARVNDLLCEDLGDTGQFMTLFAVELDRREGTARYIRAGHDPALLYDPGTDTVEELKGEPAPLLGVLPHFEFEPTTRTGLAQGQVLLIGTDGIWESFNARGEMYGRERLGEVVRAHHEGSAQDILDAVLDAVSGFRGRAPVKDDVTLVVVKFITSGASGPPDGGPERRGARG